ncbi:MAG: hypothetical protein ACREKH_04035, partial [Candidatus Rokuibacteriota bacterium]
MVSAKRLPAARSAKRSFGPLPRKATTAVLSWVSRATRSGRAGRPTWRTVRSESLMMNISSDLSATATASCVAGLIV